MLFQSYTGGRPAEFVHSSKGIAGEDPLCEAEDDKNMRYLESIHNDCDMSNAEDVDNSEHGKLDSDANHKGDPDSDYGTDGTDTTMTKDTCNTSVLEIDEGSVPQTSTGGAKYDEFGEAIRQYKALCYEDICLWIVQNPRPEGRDLLAMEVHLRHHKGVDNKPKPYVTRFYLRSPGYPSQHDLLIPGKSSIDSLSDLSCLDTSVMMLFSSMAMHPPSPSLQQTFEVRA